MLSYCSKIEIYSCKTNNRNAILNQIGISYLSFPIKLFRSLSGIVKKQKPGCDFFLDESGKALRKRSFLALLEHCPNFSGKPN